jgi:hypothetical protein
MILAAINAGSNWNSSTKNPLGWAKTGVSGGKVLANTSQADSPVSPTTTQATLDAAPVLRSAASAAGGGGAVRMGASTLTFCSGMTTTS